MIRPYTAPAAPPRVGAGGHKAVDSLNTAIVAVSSTPRHSSDSPRVPMRPEQSATFVKCVGVKRVQGAVQGARLAGVDQPPGGPESGGGLGGDLDDQPAGPVAPASSPAVQHQPDQELLLQSDIVSAFQQLTHTLDGQRPIERLTADNLVYRQRAGFLVIGDVLYAPLHQERKL